MKANQQTYKHTYNSPIWLSLWVKEKMKTLYNGIVASLLLLTTGINARAQLYNGFAKLKYDSVVLYNYGGWIANIIDGQGQLNKEVTHRIILPDTLVQNLVKRLGNRSSYKGDMLGCFFPHMGFVWYKAGKPVGHISVCLQCDQFYTNLKIGEYDYNYHSISNNFLNYFDAIRRRYNFPEYKMDEPLQPDSTK